jgi:hypothetical protein
MLISDAHPMTEISYSLSYKRDNPKKTPREADKQETCINGDRGRTRKDNTAC